MADEGAGERPQEVTVRLLKPGKGTTLSYSGTLLRREPGHVLVHALWQQEPLDLGYTSFEPGDHFYEHYYTDKWFNIFEVHSAAGELKGWYCNVARPAEIAGSAITSEDLELDLFVSADRQTHCILDMDEFLQRFPKPSSTREAALRALEELKEMAASATGPFAATSRG